MDELKHTHTPPTHNTTDKTQPTIPGEGGKIGKTFFVFCFFFEGDPPHTQNYYYFFFNG